MNKLFLPVSEPDIGKLEEELVMQAVRSGWVSSLGKFISEFETGFSSFCNANYSSAVSNGTTALHLALISRGIGPGDEVIIPSMTFVATASAVLHAGAIPVFADCVDDTGILDNLAVEKAISNKTKAIIAVHLYGHPSDMDQLMKLSEDNNLFLLEDAAEAHGALYKGRKVGSLGHMATFSFYGNKIMTTGEGGMVLSSSSDDDKRIRFLRDHAMDPNKRYWHSEVGYNYRMTNLQAALGVAQLQRFNEVNSKRKRVLQQYKQQGLEGLFGIKINPRSSWADPAPWLVSIVLPLELNSKERDIICTELFKKNIDTRPYFYPIHQMPPYNNYRCVNKDGKGQLINTISLSSRGFNLPSSPNLSNNDIVRVSDSLKKELEGFFL